jgi:hypothetical protein
MSYKLWPFHCRRGLLFNLTLLHGDHQTTKVRHQGDDTWASFGSWL